MSIIIRGNNDNDPRNTSGQQPPMGWNGPNAPYGPNNQPPRGPYQQDGRYPTGNNMPPSAPFNQPRPPTNNQNQYNVPPNQLPNQQPFQSPMPGQPYPGQPIPGQPPFQPPMPGQIPEDRSKGFLGITFGKSRERPKGTWQNTNYSASDAQAHRDSKYRIPSILMQTIYMFETQMALYSKRKAIYIVLVMAILIPLIYLGIRDIFDLTMITESSGSGMVGALLSMLPFILGLFTAFLCGSVMPSEFVERSAYMNMALPMSRISFCLGKYLAGLVITLGVFIFAYGMSIAGAVTSYDYFDEEALGMSFLMTVLAIMIYTSFSFSLGCFLKRGASILSLILLVFVFPLIEIYLYMDEMIDMDAFMMMPNLLPDMACMILGSSVTGSPVGLINMLAHIINPLEYNLGIVSIISVIWTIGFLILGIFFVHRREM